MVAWALYTRDRGVAIPSRQLPPSLFAWRSLMRAPGSPRSGSGREQETSRFAHAR